MASSKDRAQFMDSIVWCDQSYSIKEFVAKYPPPQIVRVDDGFYGSVDEETLSQGQVISLHVIQHADKAKISVAMTVCQDKTIFVPLNCPEKVEILPKGCRDRYSNMRDLLHDLPPFVRALHDTPWLNLKPGNILKRQDVVRDGRTTYVTFEFCDETRGLVRIPVDYEIGFEALAMSKSFFLKEVVELCALPVRLRFTEHGAGVEGLSDATGLKTLDDVLLEQLCEEETVIATSRHENVTTLLNIPVDLDVTVIPALGAVVGNKEYARFCNILHDGAKLEKVINWNHVRDDKLSVEKVAEYEEVAPLCPPRLPPKPETSSNLKREKGGKKSRDEQTEGEENLEPSGFIRAFHTIREAPEGQEDVYDDVDTNDKEEERDKEEEFEDRCLVAEWSEGLPPAVPCRTTSLRELVADEQYRSSGSRSDFPKQASFYYPLQVRPQEPKYAGGALPNLPCTTVKCNVCPNSDVEECHEYVNIDEEELDHKERLLFSSGKAKAV